MKHTPSKVTLSLYQFRLRFVIVLTVFGTALSLYGLASSDWLIVLTGISVLPTMFVLAYQIYTRESEVFSPLNFVFLNLLFGVTLQSFFFVFLDEGINRYGLRGTMTSTNSLYLGLLAILIGILFLIIGYSFPKSIRFNTNKANTPWSKRRLYFVAIAGIIISIFSIYSYIQIFDITFDRISTKRRVFNEDGTSQSYGYYRLGAALVQLVALVLYAYILDNKRRNQRSSTLFKMLLLISFAMGLVLPFISSQRSAILYFVISLVLLSHFLYKPWSLIRLRILVLVLVSILLFMGVLRMIGGRTDTFSDFWVERGAPQFISTLAGSANVLGIAKTGILIERVPSVMDYQYGKTYLLWIITPIPKSMWESKPVVRIGGILGPIYESPDKTGTPPGYIGEAYFNLGWLGIAPISFIFGIMLRLFYERIGKRAYFNKNMAVIYSATFTIVCFSSLSSDFTGLVSRGLQVLIPVLFILLIVNKKQRRLGG